MPTRATLPRRFLSRHYSLLFLSCCGLLSTSMARADVATQKFTVSAIIENGCILGASGTTDATHFGTLNFGNSLNVLAHPVHITSTANGGSIMIKCTPNTLVGIALNSGIHVAGNVSAGRRLKQGNGSDSLLYQLYQNPSRTLIWGNDNNGGSALNLTANGLLQTLNVYASLLATPNLPSAGKYTDTITVTITY